MKKLTIILILALVISAPVVAYTLTKDDISSGEGEIDGKKYGATNTEAIVRVVEEVKNNKTLEKINEDVEEINV